MAELDEANRCSGEAEENLDARWLEWGQNLPRAL